MLHGSGKGACMGYSSKSCSGWMYMFCLLGEGGGGDSYLQGFGGFFRGGLAVESFACWTSTLSERERRRPSRIACDISFENDFMSSSSKRDSLVHVRDCTPSWVKELPGGVADDVIFRVVGPSEKVVHVGVPEGALQSLDMASSLSFLWTMASSEPFAVNLDANWHALEVERLNVLLIESA